MSIDTKNLPNDISEQTVFKPLTADSPEMQAVAQMQPISAPDNNVVSHMEHIVTFKPSEPFQVKVGVEGSSNRDELFTRLKSFYLEQLGIRLEQYIKELPLSITEEAIKERFGIEPNENADVYFIFPIKILTGPFIKRPSSYVLEQLHEKFSHDDNTIFIVKTKVNKDGVGQVLGSGTVETIELSQ